MHLGCAPAGARSGFFLEEVIMKFANWMYGAVAVCAIGLTACGGGGGGGTTATSGPAKLQSIQVKASRTSLEAGASVKLQAVGTFSDGTSVDLGDNTAASASRALTNITWKVSDTNIAAVSVGSLQTSKVGSVVVTATDFFSSVSGSANFTVTAAIPQSLGIGGFESGKTTYSAREARPLAAYVAYSDGTRTTPSAVTWSTSNPAVFTVDANGNFQATGPGTADVGATSGTFSAKMAITIVAQTVPAKVTVSCDPSKPTVISAQEWNSQFAQDSLNSSEWVVVDGASCKANAVVQLLVPSSGGTFYRIFSATRSSSNSSSFLAGVTTTSGSSPQLTVGQSVTVGKSDSAGAFFFDSLYTFKVN
jgi:hypothetical protein